MKPLPNRPLLPTPLLQYHRRGFWKDQILMTTRKQMRNNNKNNSNNSNNKQQ
eukprot:m.131916 g.131916  ORF g.131916 m.131916 type:complete len:52 (-) comp23745_c0_seq10:12-167(-)